MHLQQTIRQPTCGNARLGDKPLLDLQTFSAERLFASLNSNVTDINFFVPGTNTGATTSAFAAIFVDVEDNTALSHTMVEFFDKNNALLFARNVLAGANSGLSFLELHPGLSFDERSPKLLKRADLSIKDFFD